MKENKPAQTRFPAIDILKTFAVFGVIVIHLCGPLLYSYPVGGKEWNEVLFLRTLVSASVPLFFMCSGVLLLNPDKELGLGKLYFKTIPRILTAMFFWGALYKIYHLAASHTLCADSLLNSFKELLLFNQEYHFYYMHIILLVYIFLPITRLFVKYASEQMILYALAVWFAFGILYPTVSVFYPFSLLSGMIPQWGINMTYSAIGYGVLGYYLSKIKNKKAFGVMTAAVGMALTFVCTFVKSAETGWLYEHFLGGTTLGVCLIAGGGGTAHCKLCLGA